MSEKKKAKKKKAVKRQKSLSAQAKAVGKNWRAHETYTRYVARMAYVVDGMLRPLSAVHKEMFPQVPWEEFQGWAKDEHWEADRQKFVQHIRQRAEREFSDQFFDNLATVVSDLSAMELHIKEMIPKTEPKSKEGLVKAYLQLLQMRIDIHDKVMPKEVVKDVITQDAAAETLVTTISEDEARAAAMAVIEHRKLGVEPPKDA